MRISSRASAQQKTRPADAAPKKVAALKLRVRTALLASCFTWLQAGRPNDHEV
jgi:hypothetical protein